MRTIPNNPGYTPYESKWPPVPNLHCTLASLAAVSVVAGPASHAHPVESKRPPDPTPHAHIEFYYNHEAYLGSLPALALRAPIYMHVSLSTVSQSYHQHLRAVPACVACGSQGILCKRRVDL